MTATISFVLSIYVENEYLDFLQRHPILANLMSNVIGYSATVLAGGIFFSWWKVMDERGKVVRPFLPLFDAIRRFQLVCDFRFLGQLDEPTRRWKSGFAVMARRRILESMQRIVALGVDVPPEAHDLLAQFREIPLKAHISGGDDEEFQFRSQMSHASRLLDEAEKILLSFLDRETAAARTGLPAQHPD